MSTNIGYEIARAFENGQRKTMSNTFTDGQAIFLHGNKIAWRGDDGKVYFNLCGWNTKTTKDRLSALGIWITQKNWRIFYRGQEIDDDKTYCVDKDA